MVFVLYCTNSFGWGWKNFTKEANSGIGVKVKDWMYGYCKFVLPIIIFIIFVIGVRQYIKVKDVFMLVVCFIISYIVVNAKSTKENRK